MGLLKKLVLSVIVFTLVISVFQINGVFSEGFNWKEEITNKAQQEGDSTVMNPVNNIAGAIITITRIICAGVAIIMLIVLAIKYISAAPGDKADIKKHAVVYVVGAVVLFAASGILGIVKNFAQNVTATE